MPPSLFLFLFSLFSFFLFFWWPQWLFLFKSHLSSLGLFCPLWDLFLTLGAILYILQEYRRSFTLYKGTHKKNVTIRAMILAHHVEITRAKSHYPAALRSSKSMYDNERSSHEKMDVAWQCISERLWKCLVGRYGGYFEERYNEAYDEKCMKVHLKHGKDTQNMHGSSINYRYVWDVSLPYELFNFFFLCIK